jgi:hypothetical protein
MSDEPTMNDLLRLSAGGQLFVTTRATLCAYEGSMLASKFSPDSQFAPPIEIEPGLIFLERDPATFGLILNYLRNGCRMVTKSPTHLLPLFRAEADYFGLVKLVASCDLPAARPRVQYKTTSEFDRGHLVPSKELDDGWKIKQFLGRSTSAPFTLHFLMEREY